MSKKKIKKAPSRIFTDKKHNAKKAESGSKKSSITPSAIGGILIGLLMIAGGIYGALAAEQIGGYFVAGLGMGFIFMVVFFTYTRNK